MVLHGSNRVSAIMPTARLSGEIMACPVKQGGDLNPSPRIGAVLLAAGEGRRMGGITKCLIRLEGVPLITRHLIALSGAGVDDVVVVTGHARQNVEEQVKSFPGTLTHNDFSVTLTRDDFPVTLIHNDMYAGGQQGSVRVGLAALTGSFAAVLILLADQPLIGADDLIQLIKAFQKRPSGNVLVPIVNSLRGNPVVIDDSARSQILSSEPNFGCRQFIDRHPALVQRFETRNLSYVTDLDTLDDVKQLAQRTGWRLELPPATSTAPSMRVPHSRSKKRHLL
jgi:molybdenum cofactor cytidylyltransferase